MEMDENDDWNVVLVEEVKPRKKLVKRVKKKKVDEGKSKIKAVESDEEQQPKGEEIKTDIKSRITQETHVNEENQNHSRRVQLRFR